MNVLLISTYEMGRQPFGLASPAAFLGAAGIDVECLDLSVQQLDRSVVESADVIAFYLPMHTATRIALAALDKVHAWNPAAYLCAYGLYAPISAEILAQRGVRTVLGGEFEQGLVSTVQRVEARDFPSDDYLGAGAGFDVDADHCADADSTADGSRLSVARQEFLVPRRDGLPPLDQYAHLTTADGERRTVGYTEASRGCKHLCRHCPVVPVYRGQFRVIPETVVLEDIDHQVAAGAQHITFGDPDFFNGPRHAADIVRLLNANHPDLSYDVTIKVEHLLRHDDLLPLLAETGCAFVTTAVESVDDAVLEKLDKGHTRADFVEAVRLCDAAGLGLQPTFVAFHPWITLEGYEELLRTISELGLIDNVPSIQLAIRLLIPAGSLLLELDDVRALVGAFDAETLGYPWNNIDPRVDQLQRDVESLIAAGEDASRGDVFAQVWHTLQEARGAASSQLPAIPPGRQRATIPYLSEPWYC